MCQAGAEGEMLPSFCQLVKDEMYRASFRPNIEVVGNIHTVGYYDDGRRYAETASGREMPTSHGQVTETSPDFGLVSTKRNNRRRRR